MGDPVGTIIAVLQAAERIYEIGRAVYKSPKEREELSNVISNLTVQVESLQVLERKALGHPDDPRYAGFRALLRSSKQFQPGKGIEPDPAEKQPGVLQRLQGAMDRMEVKLRKMSGKRGHLRRLIWIYEKKDFEEDIDEMTRWISLITSVLQYDHFIVDIETNDHVKDNTLRLKALEEEAAKAAIDRKQAALRAAEADAARETKRKEKLRLELITWLSPLRFRERHSALTRQPQIGFTQSRLLKTEEFRLWIEGRPWILRCDGKPGAGKTVLCAEVGRYLERKFEIEKLAFPVLYMFLNHKETDEQSLENLFASLLKQLLQGYCSEFRSQEAHDLYQGKQSGARPGWRDFFNAFNAEVALYQRVFVIVDALDEASPTDVGPQLSNRLKSLSKDHVSVLITSQRIESGAPPTRQVQCDSCGRKPLKVYHQCQVCHHGDFCLCEECQVGGFHCEDERYEDWEHEVMQPKEITVSIEPFDEDIEGYIKAELQEELELGGSEGDDNYASTFDVTPLGGLLRDNTQLQQDIVEKIVAKADGMYALAGLYMSSIKSLGLTEYEIIEMLDDPPEGYNDFYEQHMDRISRVSLGAIGSNVGLSALLWVVCANRPLRLIELQDALAINFEKMGFFNPLARRDKATIIRATAGLITIEENEYAAVRLNHSTAQQYFNKNRERWFPNASAHIARVSIHYMSLKQLASPSEGDWEDKEFDMRALDYPFLEYAYHYWGDHAGDAMSDPETKAAVINFAIDDIKVASAVQAMWYVKSGLGADWNVRKGANGLHLCAWFGLTYAIPELLDRGMNVNSTDPQYRQSPLMYACKRGHATTATILLDQGARLNDISNRGSSALFEAVYSDRIEVLKILLAKSGLKVNAKHAKRSKQTALIIAAQESSEEIFDLLLARGDVDLNLKDVNGDTALGHAINGGRTTITFQLLDQKVKHLDLNSQNWAGQSALVIAAKQGQVEVVRKLLAMGAYASLTDKDGGGTAILRAIDEGHVDVVRMMLIHPNVDIYSLDDKRRGLLHGAISNGRLEILQLLLEKELDINATDKNGKTPLHDASKLEGNIAILITQSLLAAGADTSIKDCVGRTPWKIAWQKGNTSVMKVLEGRDLFDFTEQDMPGEIPDADKLPIWALAALGLNKYVAQALSTRPNELEETDPDNGNTPLHNAVGANEEMVQMLLEAGLAAKAKNQFGRTPLFMAAQDGKVSILKLLLTSLDAEDEDDPVMLPDIWGTPPLIAAYEYVRIECCLLLIEAGATIPKSKAPMKQSLFFSAIDNGNIEAVRRLLQMGADVQSKNILGLTGLRMAKDGGRGDIEKLLRRSKSGFSSSVASDMQRESESEDDEKDQDEESRVKKDDSQSNTTSPVPGTPMQSKESLPSPALSLKERFQALNVPARHSSANEQDRPNRSKTKSVRIAQYA